MYTLGLAERRRVWTLERSVEQIHVLIAGLDLGSRAAPIPRRVTVKRNSFSRMSGDSDTDVLAQWSPYPETCFAVRVSCTQHTDPLSITYVRAGRLPLRAFALRLFSKLGQFSRRKPIHFLGGTPPSPITESLGRIVHPGSCRKLQQILHRNYGHPGFGF